MAAHGTPPHPWVAEADHGVRFGVYGGGSDLAAALDWVQTAEGLGFDSCWVADHRIGFKFECWTRLAALAGATRRVRLGPLVNCVYYRHAAVLARQAADIDAASSGRLVLGLGIGDARPEFAQLGLPFPSVACRQRALEETLTVVPRLLSGGSVTYSGEHVRVEAARLAAAAVQQPYVPVLLAGGGEQVTLRQVARYADASNFGPNSITGGAWTPEDVRRKCGVLDSHCANVGRPPTSVLRTFTNVGFELVTDGMAGRRHEEWSGIFAGSKNERFAGTPDHAVAYFRSLIDVGVRYFIVGPATGTVRGELAMLRRLAEEVVPAVVGT
jgi:alkanesulfonate monooxygenase SsuD/methylene tetrahydromethanopterin reductase-like flavin-dependent oxidoreductase (luciferase family)